MMSAHKPTEQKQPLFTKQQLTDIYNEIAVKPTRGFKTQQEARDKILRAIKASKSVAANNNKKTTSRPGRKPEYSDNDLIATVVDENPKKVGSAAHERFSLYKKGMKVGEYLAAGGNRADLAWDVEHKYITIRRA